MPIRTGGAGSRDIRVSGLGTPTTATPETPGTGDIVPIITEQSNICGSLTERDIVIGSITEQISTSPIIEENNKYGNI